MLLGLRFLAMTSKLLGLEKRSALVILSLISGMLLLASDCSPTFNELWARTHSWKAAPQWFPERDSIVFSHGNYNSLYEHLYEVSTDGSLVTLIPGFEQDNSEDLRVLGATASVSSDLSRLAYADFQHGSWIPGVHRYDWEIVTSAPDGSDKRRITNHEGYDLSPAWSPDGSRIAFLSTRNGAFSIFTMAPDGSDVRSIAPSLRGGEYSPFVWSPDGSRVAFAWASSQEPYWVLYTVGADGSGLTRLGRTITAPAWSADSSFLAFLQEEGNKTTLYTVGADGAGLKKVHELADKFVRSREGNNTTHNLAWSPDGTEILLSGESMAGVVSLDDSEFRLLSHFAMSNGPILHSSWSPDGSRIAVNAAATSNHAADGFDAVLYVMDPDGSNKQILARYATGADNYGDNQVKPAHGEPLPLPFMLHPYPNYSTIRTRLPCISPPHAGIHPCFRVT